MNDTSIATAYIELVPVISGIQGNVRRELDDLGDDIERQGQSSGKKFGGAFGTALKGMAGLAAGAFAVDKLKDFAVDSIAAASDLNEVGTKTSQIFGDAAKDVEAFAAKGAKGLGQSNLAVQNAVAGFGVYGKAAGLAGKDNVEFSGGLAQLATDMASFSNTSVEQATAALSSGLRGESEPLRAYGVLLDDASLRNEALAQGLITTTKDALTPQQKVLASHALIMKQTADAQGDFERTSGGLANQQRILAAQMEDMKGKVGQAFLPGITAVVTGLNTYLFPALDTAGKYVGDFFNLMKTGDFTGGMFGLEEDSPIVSGLLSFRDIVKDLVTGAGGQLKGMFDTLLPVLKEVGGTIGTALVDVFKQLWPAVKDLLPGIMDLISMSNPLSFVFKSLVPLLPQISQMVADLARSLGGVLAQVLKALTPLFQAVVGVVQRLMPLVQNLVASLLPPLMKLFESLAPLITAIVDALMPMVVAIADALIPAIEALMPIVETVFGFVASTIKNIVQVFQGLIDVLTGIFTGDWERVWTGVKEIFAGIWDQIKNIFSTLWTLISEFFTNLVPAIWGIVSAFAGQLATWGGELLGWLWSGIQAAAPAVWAWFSALPGEIWNRIVAFASWVLDRGKEFLGWLWDGIKRKAEELWTWFTALPGEVWNKISAAAGWVIDRGAEFFGWIFQGIKNGAESLWTWLSGGINDPNSLLGGMWVAIQKIGDAVIGLGKQFVDWIVSGVKQVAENIWTAITDAFTGQANSFAENPLMYMGQAKDGGMVAKAAGGPMGRWQVRPNGRIYGPGGGRDDLIPTLLSNQEFVVNAGATARHYSDLMAINAGRMASGGFVSAYEGTFNAAKEFGKSLSMALKDKVLEEAKSPVSAPNGNAVNSYDPGSFGWQRGANINTGFSWNGMTWPGGVARGTEGLWTSLLNQLVPNIPGGLKGGSQWGYENRNIAGSGNASFHSYGLALDINADSNGRGLPGYGRAGQYVIPGEVAHRIAQSLGMEWGGDWSFTDPMHFEIHLPPSALGATVGSTVGTGGVIGGLVQLIRKKLGLDAQASGFSGVMPDAVAGGKFDGVVERWRPTVLQALAMIGQAPGFADYVLNQIRTESTGDPNAINNWDSNAQRGTPSKGLVQVIDPTFRSYALPPYNQNIWDPLSNILAGIRYAIATYGSIPAGMRGVAYDGGGMAGGSQKWLMPFNGLNSPEPILTPRQWRTADSAIDTVARIANDGAVKMTVNQLPGQSAADLAREIDRRLAFAGGRSA